MKAIVRTTYGAADVLEHRDVPKPELTEDGVLVRVQASSVNPADWYGMTGRPLVARVGLGLFKPRSQLLGTDFAGTVEAVGREVSDFRPGDEVFGGRSGAFAEYVCARKAVALKPARLTFEQAAAVPIAGLTALQALRDKGRLADGQSVLINGASGGVGTFAVQIAKALGAEVTGVSSARNVELVRSLGADHVVDYTRDDFTRSGRRHDLILDMAGTRAWSEYRRVLAPKGRLVMVGAPKGNRLLGPLSHVFKVRLAALGRSQKAVFFVAQFNRADLATLRDLIEAGRVTPVIDRRYELSDVPEALRYVGEGHARGKVVVTVRSAPRIAS